MSKRIAIIGGGAAGFFTAINLAEKAPELTISIYEGSNKMLAKVLVSGGGRCNVTNVIRDPVELSNQYPRGKEFLESVFQSFSTSDTKHWFESRGVNLKDEEDGRVFPESNTSETIYNCLYRGAIKAGVAIHKGHRLSDFERKGDKWELTINEERIETDFLVLATGSNNKIYSLLASKGISIVNPLPSLFTFNAKRHSLLEMAGLSVKNGSAHIKEIKGSEQSGPVLITHWGYSAPAILKLSAWQARELAAMDYKFHLVINWIGIDKKALTQTFKDLSSAHPKDKVKSYKLHDIPKRLWTYLFEESSLADYTNWSEIGKKGIARLVKNLCEYEVYIDGKSTFKEEFVTAGGIDLLEMDNSSMRVKNQPNLYAAGEVLNIDAVTGGFNFQAAWSEAYLIAEDIASAGK